MSDDQKKADHKAWVDGYIGLPHDGKGSYLSHHTGRDAGGHNKGGSSAGKSGCFIATAATGSVDAAEVVCLQEFRDQVLLQSKFGRLAIAIYYRLSPPLARMIEQSPRRRSIVLRLLVRPTAKLARRWLP